MSLDGAGTPIGLATTQCGRREAGIPADVQAYCDVYGDSLLDGWGKRRSEWQFGLGIQHEVLPRFSAEFTYNRRSYANLTVSDQLGIGCDRFNGRQDTADVPGRLPELHVTRLRVLQCRCAKQSWPAGRRRIRDSRARQPECDATSRAADRGDDHGRTLVHVELL